MNNPTATQCTGSELWFKHPCSTSPSSANGPIFTKLSRAFYQFSGLQAADQQLTPSEKAAMPRV